MPSVFPSLFLPERGSPGAPRLGHRLVDDYLASVAARLRPNSTLAAAYDLKVFFTVIAKDPAGSRWRRRGLRAGATNPGHRRHGGASRARFGRVGGPTVRR